MILYRKRFDYSQHRASPTGQRLTHSFGLLPSLRLLVLVSICNLLPGFAVATSDNNVRKAEETQVVRTNHSLLKFNSRFAQPQLIQLGNIAHTAFAYDYSNFSFIEAPEGIIVIDAGWFPEPMEAALIALRKITEKPIRTLIYTHAHPDHIGGSSAVLKAAGGPIEVIAPTGFNNYIRYKKTTRYPVLMKRALAQIGMILPTEQNVGSSIGPPPGGARQTSPAEPTVYIKQSGKRHVAGMELEFILSQGDIPEHMMIWLPEERVLFGGDTLAGVFPYIESARYEPQRSPNGMMKSLDIALSLQPKYFSSGHGRMLIGEQDVYKILTANRDIIQYFDNQVDRHILEGITADDAIKRIMRFNPLADHPELQPHYHRIEWMIRSMYAKRVGWVQEVDDLSVLSQSDTMRRLVPMLGGIAPILSEAKRAQTDGDLRWALSLVRIVLKSDPGNGQALALRKTILMDIAEQTESANERHYALTAIKEQQPGFRWSRYTLSSHAKLVATESSEALLRNMGVLIKPENAQGRSMSVQISIEEESTPHKLMVRNNVLVYGAAHNQTMDLTLNKDTLVSLYTGKLSWQQAREKGEVKCSAQCNDYTQFASLFVVPWAI